MKRKSAAASRGRMAGLSLIELMIAMLIGLVLLLGLMQVMAASRAAYQLASGVARAQENARFAIESLQRDLRMAGHMGCVNDQAHMATSMPGATDATREGLNLWFLDAAQRQARNYAALSGGQFPLRFDLGLQGFEAVNTEPGRTLKLVAGPPVAGVAGRWSPVLPDQIAGLEPVAGSDIVVIRYLSRGGVPASVTATSAISYTITPESYGISVATDDRTGVYGLADCKQASIFASDAVTPGTGVITVGVGTGANLTGLVGDEWSLEGAQNRPMLYRAEMIVYYIGIGAGTGANGTHPPALFRAHLVYGAGGPGLVTEELVEGVESMQFLYGMDENLPNQLPRGNVQRMYTAPTVSALANPGNVEADSWRRVGTAQIGLLMRSADPAVAAQAQAPPRVLGVNMTPPANDGFYRVAYESTVAMRNRLFGN